jgi:hypothetical protein
MKPITIICSEGIIRDGDSNQITLYNLVEEINAISFPVFIHKFSIFLLVEKEESDPENSNIILKILNNERELFTQSIKTDFKGKKRMRTNIHLGGLAVFEVGDIIIQFNYNESFFCDYKIPAILIPSAKTE